MDNLLILPESPKFIGVIRNINLLAFETDAEAELIDKVREADVEKISLVAQLNSKIVGHILFTPMQIAQSNSNSRIAGLGPMAVVPDHQNSGIGTALVKEGLTVCSSQGYGAVMVLGHPDYYPKFGFRKASSFGLKSQWDVPDEAFMAQELAEGYLDNISGLIKYHPLFEDV